jgi:hypothetical protein
MGLHWSVYPREIEERIKERREELGSRSPLAKASPKAARMAARMRELSEAAYRELQVLSQRRSARRMAASGNELITIRDLLDKKITLAKLRTQVDKVKELQELLSEIGPAPADKGMPPL